MTLIGVPNAAVGQSAISIALKRNTTAEAATRDQLQRLLKTYDLSSWFYTTSVVIDEQAVPFSHPVLTLHTRHARDDELLLSTFVHEQLHWFFSNRREQTEQAIVDLRKAFPDAPAGGTAGARDQVLDVPALARLLPRAPRRVAGSRRTHSQTGRRVLGDRSLHLLGVLAGPGSAVQTLRRSAMLGSCSLRAKLTSGCVDMAVFGAQASSFADSRERLGPEFFVVVKGKHHVRPFWSNESPVRTRLTLHEPADSRQRGERASRFRGGPVAHAALNVTFRKSEGVSRCSRRSAITRRANACTLATASLRSAPWQSTPGKGGHLGEPPAVGFQLELDRDDGTVPLDTSEVAEEFAAMARGWAERSCAGHQRAGSRALHQTAARVKKGERSFVSPVFYRMAGCWEFTAIVAGETHRIVRSVEVWQ